MAAFTAWEFEKGRRQLKVRVEGQLVVNTIQQRVDAALAGIGLSYMTENAAQLHLDRGTLVRVLEDWCPPFAGYHTFITRAVASLRRRSMS